MRIYDIGREARLSRIAKQKVVFEFVNDLSIHAKWVHDDGRSPKLDEIETAKDGRVLILHSPFNAQLNSLNPVGQFGYLVVSQGQPLPVFEQPDQGDDDGGRRAKSGTGWGVAVHEEIQALAVFAAHVFQHRLDQIKLAVIFEIIINVILGDDVIVKRLHGDVLVVPQPE